MSSKCIRRPSILVYLVSFVVWIYFKIKFRFSSVKNVKIKKPAIILCNHSSYLDFLSATISITPRLAYFIGSSYYFNSPILRPLLALAGVVSKKQFATDLPAIRNIKYILEKRKGIIFMMPEATVNYEGELGYIEPSITKFIKQLNVNIYGLKIEGNNYGNTSIISSKQPAIITTTLDKIALKDEIGELDYEQLLIKIKEKLNYDDHNYNLSKDIIYKDNRANGLTNLLFICPKCHKQFTLKEDNNELICTNCGMKASFDIHYQVIVDNEIKFNNYFEWAKVQNKLIRKNIEKPYFSFSSEVIFLTTNRKQLGYIEVGKGIITIDHQGYHYKGTYLGYKYEFDEDIMAVNSIVVTIGDSFELPYKNMCRAFRPIYNKGPVTAKWKAIGRAMYDYTKQEKEHN